MCYTTDVIELTNYKISQHCKQRYAERIMDKDNKSDIARFIIENEDKIKTDINKMITYGKLVYTGRQSQKEGKGNVLNVYIKDSWVVLVDGPAKNVVTLYKIDLGLGEDFDKTYVGKMVEKIESQKEAVQTVREQVQQETDNYKSMLNDAEAQINDYKSMIKNLEELCSSYKTIVDNNTVKVKQAERDVAEVVNQLVGKREF